MVIEFERGGRGLRRRARAVRLAACAVLLCSALEAAADTLTVAGLPVRVDRIQAVDASSVSVTFAGRTEIIARTELNRYVLKNLFSNSDLVDRYDANVLVRFINQAIADGEAEYAGWALGVLARRPKVDGAELLDALDSLPNDTNTGNALEAFLSSSLVAQSTERSLGALALLRFCLLKPKDAETKYKHLALLWEPELRRLLRSRVDSALAVRDVKAAGRVISIGQIFFGAGDPTLLRFQSLMDRLAQILDAKTDQDYEALMRSWIGIPAEDEYRELFAPLVVEAIHRLVLNSIDRGDYEVALKTIAAIDPRRRTQTTHDIVRRLLLQRKPVAATSLLQPEVASFIAVLADNDTQVRDAYVSALEQQIRFLVDLGRVHATEGFFDRIVMLRPDPSPANDELRVIQARGYGERRLFDLEREKIASVQTKSLYGYRLSLFLGGWTFDAGRVLLYCLVAVLLVGWIYYRRARGRSPLLAPSGANPGNATSTGFSAFGYAPPGDQAREAGRESNEQSAGEAHGFLVDEMRLMSPSMQEYQRLLHEFGLNANADIRAIKTAYRQLVKEVHPDLHKNQDPARAQRFIELTRYYERILEIRKSMGFAD